ncbi:cellobiose dehydrogenase [Physcia stellaris]|nr:cellobiose dehydrogenase [Physcia stellaris]
MKPIDLPSVYHFEGWDIRYSLTGPSNPPTSPQQPIKPVVFVHGTPWSSAVFHPTIQALHAKELHPASNPNSKSKSKSKPKRQPHPLFVGDTSVKFQAKALTALLQHARLPAHPTAIAHDIAGTIALRAHLLHGVDFESMMLVDANAVLPWGDGFYTLVRDEPHVFVQLSPGIFDAVVRAVIRSACHDPGVLRAGWEDVLAAPWVADGEKQRSFVRQIAQAEDGDVAEMLDGELYARVRCEVKIVWGEQDGWIPRGKVEELMRRLPEGKVRDCAFIPDAGHLVMVDQPARFAVELFDWLTRFGSLRGRGES